MQNQSDRPQPTPADIKENVLVTVPGIVRKVDGDEITVQLAANNDEIYSGTGTYTGPQLTIGRGWLGFFRPPGFVLDETPLT